MWLIAFRDLQMRRRRFVAAVVAVGLVFGITLLLDGFSATLDNEVDRTVAGFEADQWVTPTGSSGPLSGDGLLAASLAEEIAKQPGVLAAYPLAGLHGVMRNRTTTDVNIIGTEGPIPIRTGRLPEGDDEIVVNDRLPAEIGDEVIVSGREFKVVGTTRGISYYAGVNAVFMRLLPLQESVLKGAPFATAIVVQGALSADALPPDTVLISNEDVRAALARPVKVASSTIGFVDVLLWFVAAGIIGSMLYMTAIERIRDFAALKAIGARDLHILVGIGLQAVVLSIAATLVAIVAAKVIEPFFPIAVEIPFSSYPRTAAIAIGVGLLGSIAGVRRAVSTDPALAFGG
jgi:putative ABC transport system permease protein